jgi:phage-related protein
VYAIPEILGSLGEALLSIFDTIFDTLIAPVGDLFSGLWNGIVEVFEGAGSWFGDIFGAAWEAIKNAFSAVGEWFGGIWDDIKNVFSSVGDWFGEIFDKAYDAVTGAFDDVVEFFGGIWDSIVETFEEIGSKIGESVSSAFKTVWNGLIDFVEDAANLIPDVINGAIDLINEIPGVDIDHMDEFDFSGAKLAKGGIVDRPTNAIIGEAGQEAIIPLENNKAGLKKIAALLADEIGQVTTGGTISKNVTYTFNQTNNSPKALSRYEIYRQTQNLINAAKGV